MVAAGLLKNVIRRSVVRNRALAQAYAEGNMTYVVRITRPVDNVFDRPTGRLINPRDPVIEDDCPGHLYVVDGGQTFTLGDEPVYYANTRLSIPLGKARPHVNDLVKILQAPDPETVGRIFRVTGVSTAGMLPVVHTMNLSGIEPAPNVT